MPKKGEMYKKTERIEPLHIVACGIDAVNKERKFGKDSPEAEKARHLEAECVRIWKAQNMRSRKQLQFCPHCHKEI